MRAPAFLNLRESSLRSNATDQQLIVMGHFRPVHPDYLRTSFAGTFDVPYERVDVAQHRVVVTLAPDTLDGLTEAVTQRIKSAFELARTNTDEMTEIIRRTSTRVRSNIRSRCSVAGITQAELIARAGLTDRETREIFKSSTFYNPEALGKIADVLDVSPKDLTGTAVEELPPFA